MNTILKNINNLKINNSLKDNDSFEYIIKSNNKQPSNEMEVGETYNVKVKDYMTRESSSTFDFMLKWNNNIPMPDTVARGIVLEETRGMFKMKLCTPSGKEWTGWIIKSAIIEWSN